jgi:hypothetical protein
MPPQSISLDTSYNERLRKIVHELDEKYLANKQPTDMFSDRTTLAGGGSHFMRFNPSGSTDAWVQPQMLAEAAEIPMSGGKKKKNSFTKSLSKTMSSIGKAALPVAENVATQLLVEAAMGAGKPKPRAAVACMGGKKKKKESFTKALSKSVSSVGKAVLPVAQDVATQMLVEAAMGAGKPKRGRAPRMAQPKIGLAKPRAVGGKRPASAWVQHVKAHAAKHGVSYKQAMSDAKHTWKK